MIMKTSVYINAHKILVIPVVLGMMWYYDNGSMEAFVYLSMHGTYSLLWLIKGKLFPDRQFEKTQPLWIGIVFIFIPLAGYYAAPYLLISRQVSVPPYVVAMALTLYTGGIFLHYVSDAQKYYTLQLKQGLIDNGLFTSTRNPNYLGEILIYSGFGILSMHWVPFAILAVWIFGFFVPNMIRKDRSLSRYDGFKEYKQRSGLLFPRLNSKSFR